MSLPYFYLFLICRWYHPNVRKWRTKKPLDDSERGEWESWLKAQHSKNEDHGIWSHLLLLLLLQSCSTLCDPIDGSPPGSPVPRILQARTLECVAIFFSNAWKWQWSHSVVSDSSGPHGLQPTRFLHPWDFPGRSAKAPLLGLFRKPFSSPLNSHLRKLRPRVG